MKKKIIKICIGMTLAMALLVVVIVISSIGGSEIAEGTYKITNYETYPDAYILVKGNTVQFYNIDLNAIYRGAQLEDIEKMIEKGFDVSLTEEQLEEASDLNKMFISNSYEIDYELLNGNNKTGTFTYVYHCRGEQNLFGLVLEYNSLHKKLQINSPVQNLTFKK